jgi:TIR domain
MPKIFVSCTRADQAFGDRLVNALKARGFEVMSDLAEIAEGDSVKDVLLARIAAADAFVFVLSRASVASEMAQRELDEAVRLGKTVVPILPEPMDDGALPDTLRSMRAIAFSDLPDRAGFRMGFEELVVTLSPDDDLAALEREVPVVPAAELLAMKTQHDQMAALRALAEAASKVKARLPPLAGREAGNQADVAYESRSQDWHSSESASYNREAPSEQHSDYKRYPDVMMRRRMASRSPLLLQWAILAATVGLAYYFYGDKLVAWVASWFAGSSAALPPLGRLGRTRKQMDPVDCSIFAPPAAPPGKYVRVQTFLHRDEQFRAAQIRAMELDPKAMLQDRKSLKCEIARGAKVDIEVRADDGRVAIRATQHSVIWNGEPTSVDFFLKPPTDAAGEQFFFDVIVFVDGQPVGELGFMLECRDLAEAVAPEAVEFRSTGAAAYKKIFFSYSSKDRRDVSLVAQSYHAIDQDFFMDILSLSAGERWERQLYRKIDECDVFMLFWSENARQSEWVEKETEYALKKEAETKKQPRFLPFPLEGPPPPKPWDSIKDRHIGSPLYYQLARNRMAAAE